MNKVKIEKNGTVISGDTIFKVALYDDIGCEPEIVIEEMITGDEKKARALIEAGEINAEELPKKRHCIWCGSPMEIKTAREKRKEYCSPKDADCKSRAFYLRKKIEEGELDGDTFKFSHRGNMRGGEVNILQKGDGIKEPLYTLAVRYQGKKSSNDEISCLMIDLYKEKTEGLECFGNKGLYAKYSECKNGDAVLDKHKAKFIAKNVLKIVEG